MNQPTAPRQADAGPDQGREIPRSETPPVVAAMPAAFPTTHLEEDRYIGVRADHQVKPSGPLPPEQASHAGEEMSGELADGPKPEQAQPPLQDVRVSPEEPSVWVAPGKPRD